MYSLVLILLAQSSIAQQQTVLDNVLLRPATYSFPESIAQEQSTFTASDSLLSNFPTNNVTHASLWDYQPMCVPASYVDPDAEPVCIYTSQNFARGRGISVIASPSNFSGLLGSPAFSENRIPAGVNSRNKPPPFEERKIPGAGRGLICNKTLHRGDRIFEHTPILLVGPGLERIEDEKMKLSLYQKAVENLPLDAQRMFWELAEHQDKDGAEDRVDTNAFGFELYDVDYLVVNPEISRINHDCRPNAAYYFNRATMTQYIHATRTIHPGEEITITYIDPLQARAKRRNKLEYNWGFQCSCSLCTQHPALRKESDSRIARIAEHVETLSDWTLESRGNVAIAQALVGLIEMERSFAGSADAYVRLALEYSALGEAELASYWARKATEAAILDDGVSADDVYWARMLAETPEQHWSWRKRLAGQEHECGCKHQHGGMCFPTNPLGY
ncbi:MAG: hypothetical protein Q9227_006133 [Pyrenula ochraceoflavens]